MTSRRSTDGELLTLLGCEMNSRPPAPTVDDLAPLVLSAGRSRREVTVTFPVDALDLVESFAAAERVCCAGIEWFVEVGPKVTLRIVADELAIEAIYQMFPASNRIEKAQ